MAYYDRYTKKPSSKRDDWRDDALTRRPARDAYAPRPPREGERYDDRPRPARDERRYDDRSPRPPREDRRYDDRPRAPRDDRRYDDRPPRAPRDDRRYDERPLRAPRDDRRYDDRPPRAPRDDRRYDERPPRPARDDRRYDERPPRPPRDDRRYDERPPRPPRDERRYDDRPLPPEEPQENLLVGRNPIREALRAGRDIEKLLVARGELTGSAREIVAMAREQRIVVQEVDRAKLDAMAPAHQGLIAVASAYAYATVDDMLELAKSRGEDAFLVLLDGVTDPHNLGAIIRSAECAGAHGVIIPERRAVGLTPAAVKASAGAVEHIPVAREANLTRTVERLQRAGVWVYGASMEGEDYRGVDFSGPAALVVGSEGSGISRLVAERCDKLVGLPMKGKIGSLNASVAAGVLLYAVMAARDAR